MVELSGRIEAMEDSTEEFVDRAQSMLRLALQRYALRVLTHICDDCTGRIVCDGDARRCTCIRPMHVRAWPCTLAPGSTCSHMVMRTIANALLLDAGRASAKADGAGSARDASGCTAKRVR